MYIPTFLCDAVATTRQWLVVESLLIGLLKTSITLFYGRINEVFSNVAISVIGPLIMGPIGGPINEVSLYFLLTFNPHTLEMP